MENVVRCALEYYVGQHWQQQYVQIMTNNNSKQLTAGEKKSWFTLYLSYFASMASRSTVSLALSLGAVKADGVLSDTDLSYLLSRGSLAYTIGKIFGGSVADMLGGKNMLLLSHLVMGLAYSSKAFVKANVRNLTILWFLARLLHAPQWPGMIISHKKIFSYYDHFKSLQASLSTSSRLGAFFGSAFGGILLSRIGSWRGTVNTVGITYLIIGFLVYVGVDENSNLRCDNNKNDTMVKYSSSSSSSNGSNKMIDIDSVDKNKNGNIVTKKENNNEGSSSQILLKALTNPKLLLIFIGNTLVIPAFDMTAILPTLLSEHINGLSLELIGTIASLFPLVSVPAVLFGAWLEPKLNDANRFLFYCSLQLMSTISLYMLSARKLTTAKVATLLMATMAGIGPMMYIIPSSFLTKFSGPYTGTFTGLIDAGGNLVMTGVYGTLLPYLKKRGGWPLVLKAYAASTGISLACFFSYFMLEAKNPTIKSPFEDKKDK